MKHAERVVLMPCALILLLIAVASALDLIGSVAGCRCGPRELAGNDGGSLKQQPEETYHQ